MSPRARTSVLDGWRVLKVSEKQWIWVSQMLTGYSRMVGYMLVWSIVVLARHLQSVTTFEQLLSEDVRILLCVVSLVSKPPP